MSQSGPGHPAPSVELLFFLLCVCFSGASLAFAWTLLCFALLDSLADRPDRLVTPPFHSSSPSPPLPFRFSPPLFSSPLLLPLFSFNPSFSFFHPLPPFPLFPRSRLVSKPSILPVPHPREELVSSGLLTQPPNGPLAGHLISSGLGQGLSS